MRTTGRLTQADYDAVAAKARTYGRDDIARARGARDADEIAPVAIRDGIGCDWRDLTGAECFALGAVAHDAYLTAYRDGPRPACDWCGIADRTVYRAAEGDDAVCTHCRRAALAEAAVKVTQR